MHEMSPLLPDTKRVVLVCPSGGEFLLERRPEGVCVPEMSMPAGQRISAHLNTVAESRWNLRVVSIGEVEPKKFAAPDGTPKYEILEVLERPVCLPTELAILCPSALAIAPLVRSEDRAVLERISEHPESLPLCGKAGPFSHLGWFEDAKDWVAKTLPRYEQRPTGRFRQLTAGASFSLVRFETEGDAVWFKAVGERNIREYAVTSELAAAAPRFIPEILAYRPEWNAWLSREAAGPSLAQSEDVQNWQAAARQFAELQIALLPRTERLLSAGAQDVRIPFLRSQVTHFFESLDHLMCRQTKAQPAPLTSAEIRTMQQSLPSLLARWEELGILDTLVHLDLNPENVLVSDDHCTFLDWAEAAVGPPFLALQYLLEHVCQVFSRPGDVRPAILAAYANPWKAHVPKAKLNAAIRLLPAVAVYAYTAAAIAGRDLSFLVQPKVAASFRSMGRRLHYELKGMGQSAAAD